MRTILLSLLCVALSATFAPAAPTLIETRSGRSAVVDVVAIDEAGVTYRFANTTTFIDARALTPACAARLGYVSRSAARAEAQAAQNERIRVQSAINHQAYEQARTDEALRRIRESLENSERMRRNAAMVR